ncbi:MAG: SIR2 family protein [Adhaeribacter sp.]
MQILEDKEEIKIYFESYLASQFTNRGLLLFVGSGFTRDCKTKYHKIVPTVEEVIKLMVDLIIEHTEDVERDDFGGQNLQAISVYFFKWVPKNVVNKFLKEYFTGVSLNEPKHKFINLNWPFIYTLNIDDAIEKNSKYEKVNPYKALNSRDLLSEKVFKLHGDASHEITYKDDESIIFSSGQYIRSLVENSSILSYFQEDYISKNFLFVGSSLENEIDLEFIIKKNEIKNPDIVVDRIFITTSKPKKIKLSQLEDFGINKILIFENYEDFYNLANTTLNIELSTINEELNKYCNLTFTVSNELSFNKGFLVGNKEIDVKNAENIILPRFITNRTLLREVISDFENARLNVVVGRRLSGKTFFGLELVINIKNKPTYFFPSSISLDLDQIQKLLEVKNSIIIFDTFAIDYDGIKYLSDSKSLLEERNNSVLILINATDRILLSIPNSNVSEFKIYELPNQFDNTELNSANNEISKLGLLNFQKNTIIDNIIYFKENYFSEFNLEVAKIVSNLNNNDILILILAATFGRVYSITFRAIGIGVNEIQSLIDKIGPYIEFEYSLDVLELTKHSSFKTLTNSKSYLFHLLGHYVSVQKNLKIVAEQVFYIVERLIKDKRFNSTYKNLIVFDNLNQIFLRRQGGVINLIFLIYEKLESLLYLEQHYWIQRAKSIYYLKREDSSQLINALTYAQKVYYDSNGNTKLELQASLLIAMIKGRLANLHNFENVNYNQESIIWYYRALQENSYNENFVENVINKAIVDKKRNDLYSLCQHLLKDEGKVSQALRIKKLFLIKKILNK